jgi:hypothetical protein
MMALDIAVVALLAAGDPSDSDWQWLNESREPAFEHFMPVEGTARAYVTFRSYRDLYQDVPEVYVSIGVGGGDALEAVVVKPMGVSIQQQLLDLHMAEPARTLGELLPMVKVQRLHYLEGSCPAINAQLDALSKLRLPLPERDVIVLHPVLHRLRIELGGGDFDLTLVDEDHPAVQWAHDTIQKVQSCKEQR